MTTAAAPRAAAACRISHARDPLVDVLRSVALVRVILWHAFAAAWLSWVFPAMPVMFFLAGSLLASGVSRSSGWGDSLRLLARRARRVLVPFWVYAVGLLASLVVTYRATGRDVLATLMNDGRWHALLSWVLPLHGTGSPDVQQDWLTGHLWYLTDYLWLLLLLPLALFLARRIGIVVGLALLGLVLLEAAPVLGLPQLTGTVRIATGDLLCYGMFAVLGMAWAVRRPAATTRRGPVISRAAGGLAAIALAVALSQVVSLPRGSLNESYLLLALAALGWLLLISAAEQPLRRLVGIPRVTNVSRGISARALTLYLWHPAAIVLARNVAPEGWCAGPVILLLTVVFLVLAVLTFGWVEDVAARRPAQWWPGREVTGLPRTRLVRGTCQAGVVLTMAAVSGLTLVAVALAGVFSGESNQAADGIPRPSDRSALSDSAFAAAVQEEVNPRPGVVQALPGDQLQVILEQWTAAQPEISDAVVGIAAGSLTWSGRAAPRLGEQTSAEAEVGIASMTKTFTAVLAVQLAAEGALDLDAPMPDLPAVVAIPDGMTVTPRQLLQHSTGLIQYTSAPGYDPSRVYTAAELVSLSTQAPLEHPPDEGVTYSNSNYLWLGLLLESASGVDYGTLLKDRIIDPLGLRAVHLITDEVPGWVGFSSGGITATPADTAQFFDALINRGQLLPTETLQEMTDFNHLNVGLGIWPWCPCGETPEGSKWATGLGHFLADGAAVAFPEDQVAVYLRLGGPDDAPVAGDRMTEMKEQLMAVIRETVSDNQASSP